MKLVFLVNLGLVLTITNVNSSAVDVNKKLKKLNEDDYKTTFTDLNVDVDCIHLVLEQLDFGDLLNVAKTNQELSSLAANVFHRKYSHYRIVLSLDYSALPNNPNELLNVAGMKIDSDTIRRVNNNMWGYLNHTADVSELLHEIRFSNGDLILNTFKHFGHAIKKLKFWSSDDISTVKSEFFGKLINKFSYESLVDVEIERNAEMVLEYIEKPLINVENVTFRKNWMAFIDHTINFNQTFPSMRRLIVDSLDDQRLIYFDCHFPYLEHLSLIRLTTTEPFLEKFPFPDVIAKNPQIRNINLFHYEPEFVERANTLLPQLETLTYTSNRRLDRSIQFENVTTLSLPEQTSPINMHFPLLQNLHIYCDEELFDECHAFLNEHRHISHWHLIHRFPEDSYFQRLIANLPDLVEMTLRRMYGKHFSSAGIVEFLRSHDNVKQLNLINYSDKQQKVELQEQLKHEWNFKIDGETYRFERKTATKY